MWNACGLPYFGDTDCRHFGRSIALSFLFLKFAELLKLCHLKTFTVCDQPVSYPFWEETMKTLVTLVGLGLLSTVVAVGAIQEQVDKSPKPQTKTVAKEESKGDDNAKPKGKTATA